MTHTPEVDGLAFGGAAAAYSALPPRVEDRTAPPPRPPVVADLDPDGPTAQALHMMSHALAQIAAELHSIRVLVEGLAPVAQAYGRGGPLAAAVAKRQQRKDRPT